MTQTLNLIEQLKQIPDYRKPKGKRHALWLVMMLVLLGTLCGIPVNIWVRKVSTDG